MKVFAKPFGKKPAKVVEGEIIVLEDKCKGCGYCINYCPRDVLAESEKFNAKGYHYPYVKNGDACTACGLCELMCPDFAIYVLKKEEK